ncbi:FlgN protein [Candidatus Thermokryptus mobilis]|uniref:FlgN protein n=1 Tax=Candidatus Thermokryptus mobilis TaxID=1643428 RepID=A0A0S4MS48_9BACT|nr:flagellar protein FlgN [Candidatus Thermokryptus mobilis]CUU01561.1 FlgN protein [Candidatus Thermokryptus mobilis]
MKGNEKPTEILTKLKWKLKALKETLEEKQKAIVSLNYDEIEKRTREAEAIVSEISFNVDMIKGLGNEKDELISLLSDIKRINFENRYLISHSLAFTKKLLEFFDEANKVNKKV